MGYENVAEELAELRDKIEQCLVFMDQPKQHRDEITELLTEVLLQIGQWKAQRNLFVLLE